MERAKSLESPWWWERLKAGGKRDDRGWDGWMTSPTRLTWVWASSRNWWWTGRPGMLQFLGSQEVGYDWLTDLFWSSLVITFPLRSKHLLISWLQSPSAVILEPPQNKVWHCFHCLPIYLPWSDGTRCHGLSFLNVEFKPTLFTFFFSVSSRGSLVLSFPP